MSSAYSNALAGLTANSQAINIVSSNLANLSTAGYKDEQVSFEDLVNESLNGISNTSAISGSTIAQGTQQFTQGTLETTNNPYDAAIQGGGFFVVNTTSGQQLFTREGNFSVNSAGQLVTATGQFVQGWNAANGTLNTNGATSNIVLPTMLAQPPGGHDEFFGQRESDRECHGGLDERHIQFADSGVRLAGRCAFADRHLYGDGRE